MGSELETAMETLINVFHAHSGKEGDKYKLSKKELKELLQTELSGFLDAQKDADAVDKVMKELDENGDGEVDFQEYVVLVAAGGCSWPAAPRDRWAGGEQVVKHGGWLSGPSHL